MKIFKNWLSIIWIIFIIGMILWLTEGNVLNIALSFGKVVLQTLGCFVLFCIICLLFPKSWFAKIFKDKL